MNEPPAEMPNDKLRQEEDLPTYSPDGVDLTLIRWMLSLTPDERLQALEGFVNSVMELRNGRIHD